MQSFRELARGALPLGAFVAFLAGRPAAASAGEIQFSVAFGGEGSSWSHAGDGAGFAGIRAGYRFIDLVAPYFLARAGYATVNQRVLELVQLGAQIWARIGITRPYFRFGLVHQHEESWASYKANFVSSFLGVGDGIRHRGGIEPALGIDIPVKQYQKWQFHVTAEGFSTIFVLPPDNKGPLAYGGGTLGFGFNYAL
jgi:hypothetical protein